MSISARRKSDFVGFGTIITVNRHAKLTPYWSEPLDWTTGAEDLICWTGLAWRKPHDFPRSCRRHSTPFKFQLCQDIRAGIIGRRDVQRSHDLSANLIHLWLTQFDLGELMNEKAEASVIAEHEARIAALERKVGQLTMELDLAKKTPRMLTVNGSERSSAVSHQDVGPK